MLYCILVFCLRMSSAPLPYEFFKPQRGWGWPSPPLEIFHMQYFTMNLQWPRIIVEDAGFEPGTTASEVWCATSEPPQLLVRIHTVQCSICTLACILCKAWFGSKPPGNKYEHKHKTINQGWGTGSAWIRINFPDPDPRKLVKIVSLLNILCNYYNFWSIFFCFFNYKKVLIR